jgi:translation initiation factor 1 (eIF-1/SUI1)
VAAHRSRPPVGNVIVQGAVMQTIKDLQRDKGFTAVLITTT